MKKEQQKRKSVREPSIDLGRATLDAAMAAKQEKKLKGANRPST